MPLFWVSLAQQDVLFYDINVVSCGEVQSQDRKAQLYTCLPWSMGERFVLLVGWSPMLKFDTRNDEPYIVNFDIF